MSKTTYKLNCDLLIRLYIRTWKKYNQTIQKKKSDINKREERKFDPKVDQKIT